MAINFPSQTGDCCFSREAILKPIWSLIQEQAALHPSSPAASQGDRVASYQELVAATKRLSALLVEHGVAAGDTIPIFVSRCLESVACILALVRLGVCYAPMDSESWSQGRVDAVLQTIQPKLVVVSSRTSIQILSIPIITTEQVRAVYNMENTIPVQLDEDAPKTSMEAMYIIFTSGTTGKPKGVVIPRRCVENYVQQGTGGEMPFNLGVTSRDRVLLLFSLAFDAAWGVFYSTLCHGGHLVLSDPKGLLEDAKQCTILPATPSLLGTIGDPVSYTNIKSVFLGGESPRPTLLQAWWSPGRRIFNCYGPTETTICTSMAELQPEQPITLGEPMRGTELLLLDDRQEESDEGEIYISGPGLAAGYYKNPQLTSERFIQWNGQRIYRTLDRARRTPAGIVFCGREDAMVKNRGYLINLEVDVIPLLLGYPGVTAAVAFMDRGRLIGCIVPQNLDINKMRRELSESHELFVVPDQIVAYDELPRTSNGKVDIAALKHLSIHQSQQPENSTNERSERGLHLSLLREAVADALGLPISSIPTHCSFWELGGNSLRAIKLTSNLRQKGLTIHFQELFGPVPLARLSERLEELPESSKLSSRANGIESNSSITAPMTAVQTGMIRSSLQHKATSYMAVCIRFPWSTETGYADKIANCWKTVIGRHSVFQTIFDPVTGTHRVNKESSSTDWRALCVSDDELASSIDQETSRLFEDTNEQDHSDYFRPLNCFRLLVPSGDADAALLWLVHHSCVDGWSVALIVEEVKTLLRGESLEEPPQFWHFAHRLPQYLESVQDEAKDFWQEAVSGVSDACPLTLPKPSKPASGPRFAEAASSIDLSLDQIEQMCRLEGVTSAAMVYAAWALLLQAYSDHDHVVFGTVFSGRNFDFAGMDQLVGPILNACPLPVTLKGVETKAELLRRIQETVLRVGAYQWSSASTVQALRPGSYSSIFQTMLFLEYDLPGFSDDNGWRYSRVDVPEFGLTVRIQREDDRMRPSILFDQTLYTRPAMERMVLHFRNVLVALLDVQCSSIAEVRSRMLEPCELLSLTHCTPDLLQPYVGFSNLKDCFEMGVDRWPDAVAIESATHSLTYSQLDALANHAARALVDRVNRGDAVAILSDRSLNWLVSVFAVVKAGAVYVPLDSNLPRQRMQTIVQCARAKLCVFPNQESHQRFGSIAAEHLLLHEILAEGREIPASARLPTVIEAQDIAYIIFTSGSTGVPKGVAIQHRSVLSYLSYPPARMDARPDRRHAQMFSPGFDVSMAEIFGTLCYGATLVLADESEPFAHLSRVNATMITPSFLSVCDERQYPRLDTILFAGEAVPQILADIWAGTRTVYNSYGPCECTIGCLFQLMQPGREVTLGRAVPRVGVYLLDSRGAPVPVGVPGEICLSGIQVSSTGYIGSGEMETLSKARFVADPFVPGQRMYRTGDRAVWTEDMEPRFLGRVDNQVKVRGFRIELEEVESAIRAVAPQVRRAAAIVHRGDNIVAFVEPENVPVAAIQEALRDRLPAYACPSAIVALAALPTTPNQKLDRKALQTYATKPREEREASLTPLQDTLAAAWREAIGLRTDAVVIAPETDFSAIGGNSLSQIKAAQIVCRVLNTRLPLTLFIRNTRLSALSSKIEQFLAERDQDSPGNVSFAAAWKTVQPPYTEVSHLEEEFVRLSLSSACPQTFNVAYEVRMAGDVDLAAMERAIRAATAREKILRTCYTISDGLVSRRQSENPCEILTGEISKSRIRDLVDTPFHLLKGPLTRILLGQDADAAVLVLVQHHAITDKVAIRTLLHRIQDMYLKFLRNDLDSALESEALEAQPDYGIWAKWRASQPRPSITNNASYWEQQLSDLPAPLFTQSDTGSIRPECTSLSDRFSLHTNSRLDGSMELYVTVVALALAKVMAVSDLVVGIPHVDRTEPGTEDLLGVFLDRLPVRVRGAQMAANKPSDLIDSVRSSIRDCLAHSMPLMEIRRAVGEDDLVQVMIVYNRREDSITKGLALPAVVVEDQALRARGAKFPLLIEFTETELCTVCEFEYMEDFVCRSVVDSLRQAMESMFS